MRKLCFYEPLAWDLVDFGGVDLDAKGLYATDEFAQPVAREPSTVTGII